MRQALLPHGLWVFDVFAACCPVLTINLIDRDTFTGRKQLACQADSELSPFSRLGCGDFGTLGGGCLICERRLWLVRAVRNLTIIPTGRYSTAVGNPGNTAK